MKIFIVFIFLLNIGCSIKEEKEELNTFICNDNNSEITVTTDINTTISVVTLYGIDPEKCIQKK
jgi:hypothetical protein